MKYNQVGRSGLKISEISLGSYLTFGERISEKDSIQIVQQAFELGVNSFDTANTYQQGEAERIIAQALKPFRRDEYVLGTKAYWPVGNGPNSRGLSRKHVNEQVHSSLKRMELDYIDIFYCHHYDSETPLEETLRTIDDLIRQGKILYAGVSNWTPEQIKEAVRIADERLLDRIIVNQSEYSLLTRSIEEKMIPVSKELGVSQIVFSPLAQGILTGKYNRSKPFNSRAANPNRNKFFDRLFTDESLAKVEKMDRLAKEYGMSLVDLALTWVLLQEEVVSAIIGASNIEQLIVNVKGTHKKLPEELLAELDTLK